MAANPSIQLGTDGNWAIKEDNLLAYKKDGTRFFNKEFDFTRNTTATFVDKDGLIKESATNTPRIDFKDNTTGHLLLEPQSTNLVTYSEDFSQWGTNQATTTLNYGISPDGTQNSTRIVFASSNLQLTEAVTTGASTTGSIYVKGVSGETIKFGVAGSESVFTLNGDWQRIEKSGTSTSNIITINTYSGATARDIEIWGAQLEELPYASSYIPTSGSTVTRNGEVCNNSGSVQDFNSEEGVLYAEIAALANSSEYREISLNDGNTINAVEIRYTPTANNLQFVVRDNGTATVAPTITLSNALEFNKIAFSYKNNDCKMYVNGIEVAIDTNCTMPNGLNRLSFNWGTINPFYGKTKNLKVFKRAMSDGELYLLTVKQYQSYQEMATALNYTL